MDLQSSPKQLDLSHENNHAKILWSPRKWWCHPIFLFSSTICWYQCQKIIDTYSQLSESKVKLSLNNGDIHKFTNAIRAPIQHHLKAKENLSAHHYLYIFHGCLDAPNKEFHNFIFQKEACFHHGGPSLLTPPRSSRWAWYRVQENQQPRAMAQARRPSSFSPSQQPPFSPGQLYFAPKGLNLPKRPLAIQSKSQLNGNKVILKSSN